jgi:hypothetical protein
MPPQRTISDHQETMAVNVMPFAVGTSAALRAKLDVRGMLLLAALSMAACLLSRALSFSGMRYSLIWPIGGIAFAAFRLWGWRGLVVVAVSEALWVGLTVGFVPITIGLIFLATVASTFAASWLLDAWQARFPQAMMRTRGPLIAPFGGATGGALPLLRFYTVQALVAAPVAALLGSLGILQVNPELGAPLPLAAGYWVVQLIGNLIYAPLVLLLVEQARAGGWEKAWQGDIFRRTAQCLDWPGLGGMVVVLALVLSFCLVGLTDIGDTLMFLLVPLLAYRTVLVGSLASACNNFAAAHALLALRAYILLGTQTILEPSPQRLLEIVFILVASTVVVQLLGAIARERERAFTALEAAAVTDSLTGAANELGLRRRWESAPEREVMRTGRFALRIALANLTLARGVTDPAALDETERIATRQLTELFPQGFLARTSPGRYVLLCAGSQAGRAEHRAHDKLRQMAWQAATPLGVVPVVVAVDAIPPGVTARQLLDSLDVAETVARRRLGAMVHAAPFAECKVADLALQQRYDAHVLEAFSEGRLVLFAQAIEPAAPNALPAAVELLTRLRAADGKLMPPDQFLPVIKRHGMVRQFDAAVALAAVGWLASLTARGQA